MIVVTGAAGKTGKAVIKQLVNRGQNVRGIIHRPEQEHPLIELGVQEAVRADMRSLSGLEDAFRGASAVYHICPNMHPEEFTLGKVAVTAAKMAKVDRFVYHSVLHPQVEAMPHHWQKMRVEEELFQSGLKYTILQPAAYMQNVLAYWEAVIKTGILALPYDPKTRINMVDLEDVSEAAAIVLTEKGHEWATYELCGPGNLSQDEVASIIGKQVGRKVTAISVPIFEWERQAKSSGLGEYALQTLVSMFQYYERYDFYGNSQVLQGLLGRPPQNFAQFVEDMMTHSQG